MFAAALGVPLDHPAPYRYPLLLAAVLLVPAVLAMLATRDTGEVPAEQAVGGAGPAPVALMALVGLSMALRVPGEAAARTFFNVYLDAGLQAPTALIGALSAAGQLVAVPAALVTPLLMARWGISRTYVWATLAMALCLLPLALIPHWSAAGLGFAGVISASSMAFPAIVVYAMMIVPAAWRPTMSAAIELAAGVSFLLASLGGGYLIAYLGYPSLFLTSAILAAAGAVAFWVCFRRPRGELAHASA